MYLIRRRVLTEGKVNKLKAAVVKAVDIGTKSVQ